MNIINNSISTYINSKQLFGSMAKEQLQEYLRSFEQIIIGNDDGLSDDYGNYLCNVVAIKAIYEALGLQTPEIKCIVPSRTDSGQGASVTEGAISVLSDEEKAKLINQYTEKHGATFRKLLPDYDEIMSSIVVYDGKPGDLYKSANVADKKTIVLSGPNPTANKSLTSRNGCGTSGLINNILLHNEIKSDGVLGVSLSNLLGRKISS